jgi:hypothetical protein
LKAKKTITICSSANFYEHACLVADELEKRGYNVVLPETAVKMRNSGNYNAADYRTWHKNPSDYHKKSYLMDTHFKEIEKGGAILVVNDEKHGDPGYIGSNVLMEIALAYWLKKPIFILNPVPETARTYEEIVGVGAIIIDNDIGKIKL